MVLQPKLSPVLVPVLVLVVAQKEPRGAVPDFTNGDRPSLPVGSGEAPMRFRNQESAGASPGRPPTTVHFTGQFGFGTHDAVVHKLVPITVDVHATDSRGPVFSWLVSITSNELVNGIGDGNTAPDWRITKRPSCFSINHRLRAGRWRLST